VHQMRTLVPSTALVIPQISCFFEALLSVRGLNKSTVSLAQLIAPKPGFFVRSAERVPCPCCGDSLKVIGSKRRVWYRSSGVQETLVVRRLRCKSCERIHHELPDVIVPYKRYGSESIEPVVSEAKPVDVAADESTLYHWRKWFEVWAPYALC
jgi:hypothetical protein